MAAARARGRRLRLRWCRHDGKRWQAGVEALEGGDQPLAQALGLLVDGLLVGAVEGPQEAPTANHGDPHSAIVAADDVDHGRRQLAFVGGVVHK